MQKLVKDFLIANPGYLKKSPYKITERLNIKSTDENIELVRGIIRNVKTFKTTTATFKTDYIANIINCSIKEENYEEAIQILQAFKNQKNIKSNVLVIGDIHEPFCLEGYLEFCKEQYDKFNCNKVVFIGDIIDQAFSSFHPTNPDGYGAGDELDRAIDKIAEWYRVFPEATIILGNHDRLAYRKAFSGGISSRWLRSYGDVLNTPGWSYMEFADIDNILYIHGEAGTARTKAKDISKSVVQGHLHSQAYIEYINNSIFAMQVGTGIDDTAYAFNYNKAGKESILSCGIVLEGKQPLIIKM